MSLIFGVCMSSYFGALLRGNWSQKIGWYVVPDFVLSEAKLEDVDVNAMAQRITQKVLRNVWKKDGSYEIDGCLKLFVAPHVQRIAKQMQCTLLGGVVGTMALACIRQWTKTSARFPYIFLASQVLVGAVTVLSVFRCWGIWKHCGVIRADIESCARSILQARSEIYTKLPELNFNQDSITLLRCLHFSETKPLYQRWFIQWSQKLLEKSPRLKEERIQWVRAFFEGQAPLSYDQAKGFFSQEINRPMGFTDSFWPREWGFLDEYQTFKAQLGFGVNAQIDKLSLSFHQENLHGAYTEMTSKLKKKFFQIAKVFERRLQNKSAQDGDVLANYCEIACRAAAYSPQIEQFYNQVLENIRLCENLEEAYYLRTRKFLYEIGQFLTGKLQHSPKLTDLKDIISIPATPQIDVEATLLDTGFYERASKLIPRVGNQQDYLQFLQEVCKKS
jgi:hypothetical protein